MAKIRIDDSVLTRATEAVRKTGYSSVEEFVVHCIENELRRLDVEEAEKVVTDQLRGLGYIES